MLGKNILMYNYFIRDVLTLKVGWCTGYPEWYIFRGFPQFIQAKSRMVSPLGHDILLQNPFQFIIHQPFYHSTS
jgi:hypothetical protein